MPKLGDQQTLTAVDLVKIAESLEYFAKRYRQLSQGLSQAGGATVTVKYWETLDLGMSKIQKAVNAAQVAFDDQIAGKVFYSRRQKNQEQSESRENDDFNVDPGGRDQKVIRAAEEAEQGGPPKLPPRGILSPAKDTPPEKFPKAEKKSAAKKKS